VPSFGWALAIVPLYAFGAGTLFPALATLTSLATDADSQGSILGGSQVVGGLGRVARPGLGRLPVPGSRHPHARSTSPQCCLAVAIHARAAGSPRTAAVIAARAARQPHAADRLGAAGHPSAAGSAAARSTEPVAAARLISDRAR
jgi:hypothetical protein